MARSLAGRYEKREGFSIPPISHYPVHPFEYYRRATRTVVNIGGGNVPRVIADLSAKEKITQASLFALGYQYVVGLDKWRIGDMACDYIFAGDVAVNFEIPGTLGIIRPYATWRSQKEKDRVYPLIQAKDYHSDLERSEKLNFIFACLDDVNVSLISSLKEDTTAVLVVGTANPHGMAEQRRLFVELMVNHCDVPVIINREYAGLSMDEWQLYAATDVGSLLVDGLGDGIMLSAKGCGSDLQINQTGFTILQATRTRISKTEYISCPSCGRTLFDLQETTAMIRSRTHHLKGIKIGIMGCIVNGPGEMADADYGYVGSGPGRITLYRGKEVVKRHVPTGQAVDELINLIREYGRWVELEMAVG